MPLTSVLSIAGVLLWAAYELVLRRREDPGTASWQGGESDRGSTRLLIGAYLASVAVNVVFARLGTGAVGQTWCWVGVAAIAGGLGLRAWGMGTLGRFYTRTLRTANDQRVVQEGPYRLIRHPGYAGSLLVWTGYSLGLGNWIALLLVAVLLLAAYTWRIRAEEALLDQTFGTQYAEYRTHTKRLIPFLY